MDAPDIRVGVLAARTFAIADGQFRPITITAFDTWLTATAVGKCHRPSWQPPLSHREPEWDHGDVPDERCSCGIYSYTTAQEVAKQFPNHARTVLAVIAPAGQAFEGELGWRAETATILAAWIHQETERAAVASRYPTVEFPDTLEDLLAAYPAVDDGGVDVYRAKILAAQMRWAST